MNAIWFLSKERNLLITGFNTVQKNGITELWVKEQDGNSRKLAEGEDALKLERALTEMIWSNAPSLITDSNGGFATNVNTQRGE